MIKYTELFDFDVVPLKGNIVGETSSKLNWIKYLDDHEKQTLLQYKRLGIKLEVVEGEDGINNIVIGE